MVRGRAAGADPSPTRLPPTRSERPRPGRFLHRAAAAAALLLLTGALLAGLAPGAAQAQTGPTAQTVTSDWPLKPSGIGHGQSFRLLFVTSTIRNAESSDIGVYNSFVQGRANAGHTAIRGFSGQFRALISTSAVDARVNTATTGAGVPIYWLNGAKVANNYAEFYNGSWDSNSPRSESGTTSSALRVYTGSDSDGTRAGNNVVGTGFGARHGEPSVSGKEISSASLAPSIRRNFYALSPVITVSSNPGKVTGVTVDRVTGNTMRVRWTKPAEASARPITSFGINTRERNAADTGWGAWVFRASVGAGVTSRVVTGLPLGARQQVRVFARAERAGESTLYGADSNYVEFTTATTATPPTLTWAGGFTEHIRNDGSVVGSITVTVTGGRFVDHICDSDDDGTDDSTTGGSLQCLLDTQDTSGLTEVYTRTSDTVITFTLTGRANSHASDRTGLGLQAIGLVEGHPDTSYSHSYTIDFFATPPQNAPTADAGEDQTVASGGAVTLSGSATDPELAIGDTLLYAWTQTSGPSVILTGGTTASPSFTAPGRAAVLVFTLTVTDSDGNSDTDTVSVTVESNTPVVTVSASAASIEEGAAVTFTFTASPAPEAEDGIAVLFDITGWSAADLHQLARLPTEVEFDQGESTATLVLQTLPGSVGASAATLTLTLDDEARADREGYITGDPVSAAVSVTRSTAPVVTISAAPATITEGGSVTLTFTADAAPTAALTVNYSVTSGTAFGLPSSQTVQTAVIPAGRTRGTVEVETAPDTRATRADRLVTFALANSVSAAGADYRRGTPNSVRVTVQQDTTAPTLSATAVAGAALVLTYSEALDTGSVPAAGAFAVTVAGSARTVSGVSVADSAVTLTLASAVSAGQTVTVAYTAPASNPIQDAAGNDAATFAARTIMLGPTVKQIDIPAPESGGTFGLDEERRTVKVLVLYNSRLTVTGAPRLPLTIGSARRYATFSRDDSILTGIVDNGIVAFAYRVQAGDYDADGIAVAGPIELNGGTIGGKLRDDDSPVDLSGAAVLNLGAHAAGAWPGVDARTDVTSIQINSEPDPDDDTDDTYGAGDTIQVGVILNGAIWVRGGTPRLALEVGTATRDATYLSRIHGAPGTTFLFFEYTVQAGDSDPDGIAIPAGAIDLNGAVLRDAASNGNELDLELAHAGLPAQSGHKVDGATTAAARAAPAVTGLPAVTGPGDDGVYAAGERIEARVRFTEPVTVDAAGGSPTLGLALGGVRREAAYEGGSGTAELVFALTVPEAAAGAAKAVANGIRLNGTTVRSADGIDAALAFGEAPGVVAVEIAAPAGGSWDAGEAVTVTLAFAEPVEVDTAGGTPSVGLELTGAGARRADYASGSGTDRLAFSWTLSADDGAVSAVSVAANGLALNGGAIRSTGGLDAALAHHGAAHAAAAQGAALPVLSVADASASEGGTLSFAVTLSPAAPGPVTVDWATADGTATAGEDYTAASGTLTFAAGETAKTVEVAVLGDGAEEAPETLTLALSNPAGATVGDGEATGTVSDPGPAPLTASFSGAPPEHDGQKAFTVTLTFSEAPASAGQSKLRTRMVRDSLFAVTGATVRKASRVNPPSNLGFRLRLVPAGDGAVTLALADLPDCGEKGAVCTADGRALAGPLALTVPGPAALSVADATVEEGPGAALEFAVTLDRARHAAVTVDYATSDGTATAGEDYTSASGTLSFAAGETAKTVRVAVLDDAHDEGAETMMLALSNASGARIADGEAVGTIENADPAQKAWIARFGRTVADQVIEAVDARIQAPRTAGTLLTLGGQPVALDGAADAGKDAEDAAAARDLAAWLHRAEDPEEKRRRELQDRGMSQRELLLGSSFSLAAGDERSGHYALWGRGAVSRFDGREGDLTVDGEVASAFLGADWSRERTTLGLILGHSIGDGGYASEAGSGTVSSTLTGLYPWMRRALSDRVSVWGVAGYGEGTLTMTPANADGTSQAALRTDLELMMGAVGLRGVLVEAPETGGIELAVKTDAMGVRTRSAAVTGATGNLAAATAEVTRLRLGLEGSRPFRFEGGAALTPSLEIGVRQDGGDAETGFGVEAGGGIAWTDPQRGLSIDLSGRGLVSHESKGFREAGLSGALSWDGRPDSGRGPSLTLSQSVGGQATGGVDGLFENGGLAGLAANENGAEDGPLAGHRFEARFGYGLPAFGDGFTATPELGFGLSDAGRDYRLGWRLTRERRAGETGSLELLLETTRRESVNDNGAGTEPEHTVGFKLEARF